MERLRIEQNCHTGSVNRLVQSKTEENHICRRAAGRRSGSDRFDIAGSL